MRNIQTILYRIVAVFVSQALKVVGAGTIVGIETWKSLLLAGGLGVAKVVEGLARAYLDDGKLTKSEIDDVFNSVDTQKSKESE